MTRGSRRCSPRKPVSPGGGLYAAFMRKAPNAYRTLTPIGRTPRGLYAEFPKVSDLIYAALGLALFAAFGVYARLLRRL